jgi:hypothetical protein
MALLGLRVAGHATAVLEQFLIVGRDSSEERFHGALDIVVAGRCVSEQGAVVDQ